MNVSNTRCRDSSVGIATGCRLNDGAVGVPSLGRVKNFLFSTSSRPVLGPTRPPIQWVPGALSPVIKGLGHEADHSPPTSAEVKKTWIYTSTTPYAFMAQCTGTTLPYVSNTLCILRNLHEHLLQWPVLEKADKFGLGFMDWCKRKLYLAVL
jgi:hypothetical protein